LRRLGVFECYGLNSDKVLVRVGSDGRVRGELELADGGNISGGGEQLEGGLLLRVSNVDGDLAGTKVLQGRSRIVGVFDPLNGLWLTSLPRGGGGGGGGVDGGKSRGQDGGQSQEQSSGTHCR